jgi:hypothetical protein
VVEVSRESIFRMAAAKLRTDFDELSSVPHSGLKGGEAEELVRTFLNQHLPKRFHAGAGFIIDKHDTVSKQTDVVIYDALNCPVYRASETAAILPVDNVSAVVEVKSTLDKQKLQEAAANIAAAKRLAKSRPPTTDFATDATLGCVFAFGAGISLDKLGEHYESVIREAGQLGDHIDLLAVLDVGVIMLMTQPPGTDGWYPVLFDAVPRQAEGFHLAVGTNATGKDTLDYFLRMLLGHLLMFRQMVDHPGFDWQQTESGGVGRITYLTSLTAETDPNLRAKKMREYREQVSEQFRVRDDGGGDA